MREVLLTTTFQSTILLAALWIFLKAFPTVPANTRAWLWRIAFLKPLFGLLPMSVVPLRILPPPPVTPEIDIQLSSPVLTSATPLANPISSTPQSTIDPWIVLWTIGASLVAAYWLWGIARTYREARSTEPVSDPEVVELLDTLTARAGLVRSIHLRVSENLPSAMLLAGASPVIVVPKRMLDRDERDDLRMTLAHEVAHVARRDLPWLALTALVQIVFFFNPFIWIAARSSRLDHESATDWYASRLAKVPIRAYAAMLIRATVGAKRAAALGSASIAIAESYRTIHRRLEAMKHFNSKPTFARRLIIGALVLLTLSLFPIYQVAQALPMAAILRSIPDQPKPTQNTRRPSAPVASHQTLKVAPAPGRPSLSRPISKPTKSPSAPQTKLAAPSAPVPIGEKRAIASLPSKPPVMAPSTTPPISQPARTPSSPQQSLKRGVSTLVLPANFHPGPQGITIEFNGISANEAFRALFKQTGKSVVVSTDVKGTVSCVLSNVTFEVALSTLLKASGTTAEIREGVYFIQLASSAPVAPSSRPFPSSQTKTDNVTMTLDGAEFSQVMKALFRNTGRNYALDEDIEGKIRLDLKNVNFDTALNSVLTQVGAKWEMKQGIYHISNK
ncbi:MAG: hypothetical protein BGO01_01635 [Armatimonadetes bacterium 55-13]|nr:hypothetical protein [Armatimonadota bacterium]OJU65644.1 MAG: hypothetical protein BGO01_01635 [Armatimonadetes bacterium 55-13]